jgi:ribosomal protein S18 acetylase RimI-like enzyme
VQNPNFELITPTTAEQIDAIRLVLQEYASQIEVDLSFQDFEAELQNLPGDYAQPDGALLLATVDGEIAGCCAMRSLKTVDYPNACEFKRLYVRRAFRRMGLGRQLVEAVLEAARMSGYSHVLLDTLNDMESARALYEDLGFEAIAPYYFNPVAGAHYLKADLL